jgi:UDP-N-acetylmuramoyl-tripeptide--D-alanyl-D-alanine ligase
LVPIKLLTHWEKCDIYVAEMGIDSNVEPKNMSYLLKIIKPDIGIFLNVGIVHGEYFESKAKSHESRKEIMQKIASEKGKLIVSLPKSGYAILNADDPNVSQLSSQTKASVYWYGSSPVNHQSAFFIQNFSLPFPDYVLPKGVGYTFAAAACVGKIFDLDLERVKAKLQKNLQLPPGRSSLFKGINDSLIIDSSYNSSLLPTGGFLKLLKVFPGRHIDKTAFVVKRRIAILGDMRELGNLAQQDHESLAEVAVDCADYIFTFGPLMENYFKPHAESRIRNQESGAKEVKSFREMPKLIEFMKEFIKPGDLILIKGSQNTIFLETLVEALLANKSDASKLCRRGGFWEKKRIHSSSLNPNFLDS